VAPEIRFNFFKTLYDIRAIWSFRDGRTDYPKEISATIPRAQARSPPSMPMT
jgi:hypothetical protein